MKRIINHIRDIFFPMSQKRTYVFEKWNKGKDNYEEIFRKDFYISAWAIVIAKIEGADHVWSWEPDQNPHSVWSKKH